jgi:hypothetical protein
MARGKSVGDTEATRYAISVAMVRDHLDDKRIALTPALKRNRIPIAKEILADVNDIEHALRVRIGRLAEFDGRITAR